jgi:hypothetical protein
MCRTRGVLVVVRGTVDRPGAAGHGTHASTHRRNAFHISVHWHMDMRCNKTAVQHTRLAHDSAENGEQNIRMVLRYRLPDLT